MHRRPSTYWLVLLVALTVTGCASGTTTGRAPTPSPTATNTITVPMPSPTPPPGVVTAILPGISGMPQASPDGTVFLVVDLHQTDQIAFYRADGTRLGQYAVLHADQGFTVFWLPDSSGVLVASATSDPNPLPVLIVSIRGQATPIGLQGDDAQVSADGQWIASEARTPLGNSQESAIIQVAPRRGGTPQTVLTIPNAGSEESLLGWVQDRVIYQVQQTVYAYAPATGVHVTLGPSFVAEPLPSKPSLEAPDGSALFVMGHQETVMLVANGAPVLLPTRLNAEYAFWAPPHVTLGNVQPGSTQLVLQDIVTGATTLIPLPAGRQSVPFPAVNASWVAFRLDNNSVAFFNLATHAEKTLPALTNANFVEIAPVAPADFVLTDDATYQHWLIDPSRLP